MSRDWGVGGLSQVRGRPPAWTREWNPEVGCSGFTALNQQRQANLCHFKAIQAYILRLCIKNKQKRSKQYFIITQFDPPWCILNKPVSFLNPPHTKQNKKLTEMYPVPSIKLLFNHFFLSWEKDGEMAQWVKGLPHKLGNPSLTPRTRLKVGEQVQQHCPLACTCLEASAPPLHALD